MHKKHVLPILLSLAVTAGLSEGCDSDGITVSSENGETEIPSLCEETCVLSKTCCADVCTDLTSDISHCGNCSTVCDAESETCADGRCVPKTAEGCDEPCSEGRECCGTICADISTDAGNCGECGRVCDAGQHCTNGQCVDDAEPCICPEGQLCNDAGVCVSACGDTLCADGETCCGTVCTDLTSTEYCGSCTVSCTGDTPKCKDGVCVSDCTPALSCATGQNCGTISDGCGGRIECGACTDPQVCIDNVCTCTPTTCAAQGKNCGTISDGCGKTLDCGTCSTNQKCENNQCVSSCTPTTCAAQGKNCGTISDGCGKTLNCGTCSTNQKCENNQCVSSCTPTTCAAQGKNCGTISDGCGKTLNCGTCSTNQKCENNQCVSSCTPTTCAAQGKNCGTISDGCGKTLNCGTCSTNQKCENNQCVSSCTPTTCAAQGKNCGTISDGCGKTLNCGTCTSSQTCTNNVCTCKPTTCAAQGKNCGTISDGCGKTLNCGSCASGETCQSNVCKKNSIKDTYPKRKSIKGIQPDFQNPDQIIGNEGSGVAFNFVFETWMPTKTSSCAAGQYKYDGYCFNIDLNTVNHIKRYSDAGLVVTAVIYGSPTWARKPCSTSVAVAPYFCAPTSEGAKDYGRFAGFIAQFFNGENGQGRVADFVIHNEVNSISWFNNSCTSVSGCNLNNWTSAYAESYNAAYDYIIKEQKQAKVLISFDHYFGKSEGTSVSAESFLGSLIPKLGTRDWRLAFHSYPPDLLNPTFGADDWPKITFGNIGVLAGWLRKNYPSDPHAWEIQLTENGINGYPSSRQAAQNSMLCQAFRNVLGTPGVESFIYHRLVDHETEQAAGLGCGLWNSDGSLKPAWTTWALANRTGVGAGYPSCGFELLPYIKMTRGTKSGMHWITTRQLPSGFKEEMSWKILREPEANTKLVYECRVGGASGGHAMISPAANCEGQFSMGPLGYLYNSQKSGTVPIYRCLAANGSHLVTSDAGCEGHKNEGIMGYAYKL